MEERRLGTRNALIHGGTLASWTVNAVAAFAEQIAAEALAACIEAHLLGQEVIDFLLTRDRRLADVRARLGEDEPPSDALFWES